MSHGSRWVEAGDRRDGKTLRTPRLDLWSWLAAAVGSTLTCIPFVQLALLARIPLVFSPQSERPKRSPGRLLALVGGIAALVPIGAPLVAMAADHPARLPWAALGVGLAVLATAGHAALGRHLHLLEAGSVPRIAWAVALSGARIPVALALLWLQQTPIPEVASADDALPAGLIWLAGLAWLDLGLGALAATSVVTLVRGAGWIRLPPPSEFETAEQRWWQRLDNDPTLTAERNAGGFLARGEIDGFNVAVDVLTSVTPTRLTVRVSLPPDPVLAALEVVGRGEEDADVSLPDPILQRMIRVSGVSAADAAMLLEGQHEPLFEVLRAHEDSRVGGGCVIAVGDAVETDPDALGVDAVLQPALRLAAALAAQTSQDTGSIEGR